MRHLLLMITLMLVPMHTLLSQSLETKLIPAPAKAKLISGKFVIARNFNVSVQGNPNARIYSAVNRFLQRLDGRTAMFFNLVIGQSNNAANAPFVIKVNSPGNIKLYEDESYNLTISPQKIELTSETDLGAIHGLETLLQLLSNDSDYYYFPACEINDKPRFVWRGLMLDVARHFLPVDVVKRNIDGLASVKMNVLHLHLSDDQGFRVESKISPKLHQLGSDGFYFTQEQIKDIIAYANQRGIRVIPEFDMPGHTTSWFAGHPELASLAGDYSIERKFGIMDPTMDPTKETTYEFLDKFIGEMSQLFNDEYFHIGGDENNGKHWDKSPTIQAFKLANNIADNHALQGYFNTRLHTILEKHGKKMIGWDEIMHPDLPGNAIIQSWRGKAGLAAAARAGYQVILSNGYYIDLLLPAREHYLNDPLPLGIGLTEEQKKLVLGGEATLWSEVVTAETADSRIWPRTAAIAERLWSPSNNVNIENMYKRLDLISIQLEELGLTHKKNTEMILRRLCQCNDIEPLQNLIKIVEPVKIYERASNPALPHRSISPFTRVADAATADAPESRQLSFLVEQFLMQPDKTNQDKLAALLHKWDKNTAPLQLLVNQNPVLNELIPVAADLQRCATVAQEAISFISRKKKPSSDWANTSREILAEARKHKADLELPFIPAIEKLVDYALK